MTQRILIFVLLLGSAAFAQKPAKITIKQPQAWRGWNDALVISNGLIEAIVVPSIGRVMQLRFVGETAGAFWENEALAGKPVNPESKDWGNFGGDKSWPAPQADWPKITPRAWPPPVAFDSRPCVATVKGNVITLTSPVDPHYGIRVIRTISLDVRRPVMKISTAYEKAAGEPRQVAIWVITQLPEPAAVYVPLPLQSINANGYVLQSKTVPPSLKREGQLLSLVRDKKAAFKIGTDASTMLWLGERFALRIDSRREPNKEHPDSGSSAEVYTNPDPLAYVELETLGPLHEMRKGDRIERTNTYTLSRRTQQDVAADARKALRLK
jgi:hypothetical protein